MYGEFWGGRHHNGKLGKLKLARMSVDAVFPQTFSVLLGMLRLQSGRIRPRLKKSRWNVKYSGNTHKLMGFQVVTLWLKLEKKEGTVWIKMEDQSPIALWWRSKDFEKPAFCFMIWSCLVRKASLSNRFVVSCLQRNPEITTNYPEINVQHW